MPTDWPKRDVGDAAAVGRLGPPFDQQDGEAAEDQRHRDDHRIAEQQLDRVADRQPDHHRRNEGDEQVADEGEGAGLALPQADQHVAEGPPVEHEDGEDRAGLDGDVEQRPFVGVIAEQLGRQDQVPGRGDRQIFGDALDDAEDDDQQEDRHVGLAGRRNFAARGEAAALAEAAEPFRRDRGERASA